MLFTITATTGGNDASRVAALDLRTGTHKILVQGGSQAQYVPSGHLVYVASGTLRVVAFDLERLEVVGTPIPVVPQVVTLPNGTAEFDVADNGTLVYVPGGAVAPARTLVWVDRQGREAAINVPGRAYVAPRLSPDGARVALEVRDQNNDIWVFDFARETLTRVTFDPGLEAAPTWMPDGRRMVFSSQPNEGAASLFWQAADGTGTAERLTENPSRMIQFPSAVSPDGTRVLFTQGGNATATDVMSLTLDKDHRVQPVVQTQFAELNGEISPDGRWLAYQSNDSGQVQIFVVPFPNVNTGRWQVSIGGGTRPLWARNGQELFYLTPDATLMSMPVARGTTWTPATPEKLIDAPYYGGTTRNYDVSPDGKRFLMIKQGGGDQTPAPTSIVVVQNWPQELKRLAPTTR